MNQIARTTGYTAQAAERPIYSRVLCWRVHQPVAGRDRVFNVLLRSSHDGYFVRLSELMPKRDGDMVNLREYVTLTNRPDIGAPSGEAFYRQRVRLRNEMIGWIKAQLKAGAVELTRNLPVPAGVTITRSSGDYYLLAYLRSEAPIVESAAMADDFSDLDEDHSWRILTDDDKSWTDR
ncbi:hypothetical protein BZM27_06875 [Paraburkholderia steynii]|uniref:Uncharacterized protein n=1 Tax=Paraburkholderia steynii TaxID=1245441 RepID=A0A4R0XFE0_9BURK|nr:hypothetical protein BZM27_06875 [Paraburkholderia steynii]